MRVVGCELLDVAHLVGGNLVEVQGKLVDRLQDVGKLSAIAIGEDGGGDGRRCRLELIGESLADGEAFAVKLGKVLEDRVGLDLFVEELPGDDRMALGIVD